jgi:hypothetical protein
MPETSRVQRWREGKRQHGLKAITIWVTTEEELHLKDLALQGHCSPSAVLQRALAQFSPQRMSSISTETDTSQIRELIRTEFIAMQAEKTAATDTVTDTVTEVVTETLARDLPALVRQLVEGLALEALGLSVTDTDSDVTDTEMLDVSVIVTNGNATDTEPRGEATTRLAPQRTRSAMRQRILTLLGEHPEGLSAEEIRVHLKAEKSLGDTLQGMRRQQKVRTRGTGKDMRYFMA